MIHDNNRPKYDKKKLRRNFYGSDDEKRLSALLTMEYIVLSVANAYHEEAKDLMQQYAVYDLRPRKRARRQSSVSTTTTTT